MTCKSSFFRSMLENLKRRLWMPAVVILYFFFAYPIAAALSLSAVNLLHYDLNRTAIERVQEIFRAKMASPEHVMCILLAVMCAMQGFSYLHKKSRVDMYHSVPVSKRKHYTIICLNGLLIYIVPYFINLMLTYLVGAAFGAVTPDSVRAGMLTFGYAVLLYLMVYFTTGIAMMLTGNSVIAFILAWILLGYEPMIRGLVQVMSEAYFHTYVSSEMRYFITPIMLYAKSGIIGRNSSSVSIAFLTMLTDVIKMGIYSVAACLLGYLFYVKRPSEACGRALSFSRSKALFKFLLVVPFGVILGAAFYAIANDSPIFAVLGITIGVVIAHCVMEVIYEFDIRSLLNHKLQLLILLGVTGLGYCIFQFDLLGYNRYVPLEQNVASAYIRLDCIDDDFNYYDEDGNYEYKGEYIKENMYLTDVRPIIQIAKASYSNQRGAQIQRKIPCTVTYRMRDGKTISRRYYVDYDVCREPLEAIYSSKEYKEGIYQDMRQIPDAVMKEVSYRIGNLEEISLYKHAVKDIMQRYQEEMQTLTLEEAVTESPIGILKVKYVIRDREITSSYPVYASYETVWSEIRSDSGVNEILRSGISLHNGIYSGDVEQLEVMGQKDSGIRKTFQKQSEIEKIVDKMQYVYDSDSVYAKSVMDPNYIVYVQMKEETTYEYDSIYSVYYYFKEGEVPAVVEKAFR